MLPEKIKITDELINLIINTRKEHNLTAYQLSEKIGKNKSWLPNIENKRTKNITRDDLYLLFNDFASKEELLPEQYIIRHLPRNSMIELIGLDDGVGKKEIKMYHFLAHYIDMDTNTEVMRKIEIDGQFFDTEKEIYLCAIGKAYDMIGENEMFSSLEFISC